MSSIADYGFTPGEFIYFDDYSRLRERRNIIKTTRHEGTCPKCKSDRLYTDSGNCRDCDWANGK